MNDTALELAAKLCDVELMENLIRDGAYLQNSTDINYKPQIDQRIALETEIIPSMSIRVLKNELELNYFTKILACLRIFHQLDDLAACHFYIPKKEDFNSREPLDVELRFEAICDVFYQHKMYDFNWIIENLLIEIIENNHNYKEQYIGFNKLLEFRTWGRPYLYFRRPAECYFNQIGFRSVSELVSVQTFNRINKGREIASLQRLCRSTIRSRIFKRKHFKDRKQIQEAIHSLNLPECMQNFLRYK